jgi:outer membrane usher protein
MNVGYISPYTTLSASASSASAYKQASASISGGVVGYAGGVAFTPQVGDTVAIVEAKDAAGARIPNSVGGRVSAGGRAVVANLMPFESNQIEIDPKGLPMNVELKSTTERVTPTLGAVVKVSFETENLGRAAVFRVKTGDGRPLPFGADVLDANGVSVGMVAQGGRVIVRGLRSDSGRLAVKWGLNASEACSMEYTLPEIDKADAQSVDGRAQFAVQAEAVCRFPDKN